MVNAAPWWGVPVIAGGFLVIGGMLTFLYTVYHDWRKTRRERKNKWQDKLYDVVVDVIEFHVHMDQLSSRSQREIEEGYTTAHAEKMLHLASQLELLDPKGDLAFAAQMCLADAIRIIGAAARGNKDQAELRKITDEATPTFVRFLEIAQKRLGVL